MYIVHCTALQRDMGNEDSVITTHKSYLAWQSTTSSNTTYTDVRSCDVKYDNILGSL